MSKRPSPIKPIDLFPGSEPKRPNLGQNMDTDTPSGNGTVGGGFTQTPGSTPGSTGSVLVPEAQLDEIMAQYGIPVPNSCKTWTEEQKEEYKRQKCKMRAICKAWGACPKRSKSRKRTTRRKRTSKSPKKCPKCSSTPSSAKA